jgi:hypothetical protein
MTDETSGEEWGDWRSFCHEMKRFCNHTDELVDELMSAQVESFMPPESSHEQAWRYAADLWQVGISPQDLELLPQLARVCMKIAHDAHIEAYDGGDWDYYYRECNTIKYDEVIEEEGRERIRTLAESYWEGDQNICFGLVHALQKELGMEYVPCNSSLYVLYENVMIDGLGTHSGADFSGIVFTCGEHTWSPGWDTSTSKNNLMSVADKKSIPIKTHSHDTSEHDTPWVKHSLQLIRSTLSRVKGRFKRHT